MIWHLLKATCNDLLHAELPESLKQAMDDNLSIGLKREELWYVMQACFFEAGAKDWQLSYVAVHAYLFPEADEVPPYPASWTVRTSPGLPIDPWQGF